MKKIIILVFLLLQVNSCTDSGTEAPGDPKISFSPQEIAISNQGQTEISLKISDFKAEIFALSMQLTYDGDIVSIDEAGFSSGDFFGENGISLIKVTEDNIHLSLSLTQGMTSLKGSGTLCKFSVKGITNGNCTLSVDENELVFYDSAGNPVEIEDLSTVSSSINVE